MEQRDRPWGSGGLSRGPALCWRRRGQRVTDRVRTGGCSPPASQLCQEAVWEHCANTSVLLYGTPII